MVGSESNKALHWDNFFLCSKISGERGASYNQI